MCVRIWRALATQELNSANHIGHTSIDAWSVRALYFLFTNWMSILEAKIHVIYNVLKLWSKRAEICSGNMVGRLGSWNEGLADQLPTLTSHLRSSKVDLFSLVIIRSIGWDRRRRKGWYRIRDFVSRRFFCMKKMTFYMLSFPIDTFVKWILSFLVWKENIRILCCNLSTFAR